MSLEDDLAVCAEVHEEEVCACGGVMYNGHSRILGTSFIVCARCGMPNIQSVRDEVAVLRERIEELVRGDE